MQLQFYCSEVVVVAVAVALVSLVLADVVHFRFNMLILYLASRPMLRRCFQLALVVLSAPLQLRRGPMNCLLQLLRLLLSAFIIFGIFFTRVFLPAESNLIVSP